MVRRVAPNEHIPGATVTTAYRVGRKGRQLARERRTGPLDFFSLGYPLGELVLATAAHLYGADPRKISLENWLSNQSAGALYRRLGFEVRAKQPDVRPTLELPGTIINGETVFEREEDGKVLRLVHDVRVHQKLANHPLLVA